MSRNSRVRIDPVETRVEGRDLGEGTMTWAYAKVEGLMRSKLMSSGKHNTT